MGEGGGGRIKAGRRAGGRRILTSGFKAKGEPPTPTPYIHT